VRRPEAGLLPSCESEHRAGSGLEKIRALSSGGGVAAAIRAWRPSNTTNRTNVTVPGPRLASFRYDQSIRC
jgi:hypothetical protein